MTAPRAQEPWHPSLPLRHDATDEQIKERAYHLKDRAQPFALTAREFAAACAAEARRASSADTRRLDWLDREGAYWGLNRAAIDAAMTQEGEAKQARESDRWLAEGPDLNEEGDA